MESVGFPIGFVESIQLFEGAKREDRAHVLNELHCECDLAVHAGCRARAVPVHNKAVAKKKKKRHIRRGARVFIRALPSEHAETLGAV